MSFIQEMPKVELHVHLEGAITPSTLLALAARNDLVDLLPSTDPAEIANWFVFTDFYHFSSVVRTIKNVLRTADDFALAVHRLGEDLARQNVRYAEVTVTPYTYLGFLKNGLTIEDILQGLGSGREQVRRELGVELNWIFDIPRNRAFSNYRDGGDYVIGAAEDTLQYALLGREVGVVALGLAGNEVNAPPEPFAPVFAEARKQGLKAIPHAGEGVGAESVWGAVNALHADRIGHGVRASEDPRLVELLAEKQIPLEVSLTSNVYLRFYNALGDHPFPVLDRAGVLLTINTDDPVLFFTSLNAEYQLLIDSLGYSRADVLRLARNGFLSICAEPTLKTKLLAEFDTWAARSEDEV